MFRGFAIGRLFGIQIRLDASLLIIFLLIVSNLALAVFPAWHPDWAWPLDWGVATAAGVLFLLSVLAHELAHSLVAKAQGEEVASITLFLFGGVSSIEGEPKSGGREFVMAVVGPLTSIVLGVLFLLLAGLMAPAAARQADPMQIASALGPVSTLLAWLGPINILLGLFNLLPGFPLDGGRMLRAALWAGTGDLLKATRWASWSGRLLGWTLVGLGVLMIVGVPVPIFGVGLGSGLWLVLIGWFLGRAAVASWQQTVVQHTLEDVRVEQVMSRDLPRALADVSVAELVEQHLSRADRDIVALVEEDGTFVGMVGVEQIKHLPRERWPRAAAREIMVPRSQLRATRPEQPAVDALRDLGATRQPVAVVDEQEHLQGLVRIGDLLRWLDLHGPQARPA